MEDSDNLWQIIYTSAACEPMDQLALEALLTESRDNNARRGVSGILLYASESFLQVLEGDKAAVWKTYLKIASDCRHEQLILLHEQALGQRDFPGWSMAFRTSEDFAIEGLVDYLHPYRSEFERRISEGDAKQMLRIFKATHR